MYRQKKCPIVLLALPDWLCDGGVLVRSTQPLCSVHVPGADNHEVLVLQLVIAYLTCSVCLSVVGGPGMGPGGGEGDVVPCWLTSRRGGLDRENIIVFE